MLTDEEMYFRMGKGWRGGAPETICGAGSKLAYTEKLRKWLPRKVRDLGIRTICDAGAGDLHWMNAVKWLTEIEYRGFDLIPRHPDVEKLDLCQEDLPECDLIICRLVLGHLNDDERRDRIAEMFRRQAKYLMATTFVNYKPSDRETVKLDMRKWFGEPMEMINDGNHNLCRMGLWRMDGKAGSAGL